MTFFGTGIDVVEVQRVTSSMDEFGERFASRIFTQAERDYCEKQKRPSIHYAARFAAKEAVAKALGTGIGKELSWLDVEVLKLPSGEPQILLSGGGKEFAEKNKITEIKISLSHADHYAVASAMVLCEA